MLLKVVKLDCLYCRMPKLGFACREWFIKWFGWTQLRVFLLFAFSISNSQTFNYGAPYTCLVLEVSLWSLSASIIRCEYASVLQLLSKSQNETKFHTINVKRGTLNWTGLFNGVKSLQQLSGLARTDLMVFAIATQLPT